VKDRAGGAIQVKAVVLTHRRRRLAGELVRSLVSDEGFSPSQIVVVVNEDGGLDDDQLEEAVDLLRLGENLGPAGGFRAGMEAAFSDPAVQWAYLCEDDVGLFDLPHPRLDDLLGRVGQLGELVAPVGAVVAYGRRLERRRGHATNLVPPDGTFADLAPVDVAAWGATLVSRRVFDAGVLPDTRWFFGYEDFDFFCRVREAGFSVMVDAISARRIAKQQTSEGRDLALGGRRPTDADEPWRAYYMARNFFCLARRHGRRSWEAWHLLYSLRRMQLSKDPAAIAATLRGLYDGARGRLGRNPRYTRTVGELPLR